MSIRDLNNVSSSTLTCVARDGSQTNTGQPDQSLNLNQILNLICSGLLSVTCLFTDLVLCIIAQVSQPVGPGRGLGHREILQSDEQILLPENRRALHRLLPLQDVHNR